MRSCTFFVYWADFCRFVVRRVSNSTTSFLQPCQALRGLALAVLSSV